MRSTEEVQASSEQLLNDLKQVVRDGEALLRATSKDLSERGAAARERLSASLETAKETSRKLGQQGLAGIQATNELVRDHPYRSVGIAFGVGLVVGVLLKSR